MRFRLRHIFVLFVIVAASIGATLLATRGIREQANAVGTLRDQGFFVDYYHSPPGSMTSKHPLDVPQWCVDVFGMDAFTTVEWISSDGATCDARAFEAIADLPDPYYVSLSGESVTDQGLLKLRSLPRLNQLRLEDSSVTGRGLHHLSSISDGRVSSLWMRNTALRDRDLRQIHCWKNLKYLSLYGTNISDDGLEYVGALPVLEGLNIGQTAVVGDGLHHLSNTNLVALHMERMTVAPLQLGGLPRIRGLRVLSLDGVPLSNQNIRSICHCKRLESLSLAHESVSDRVLLMLAEIKSLRSVAINVSQVTDQGVARFHAKRRRLGLEACDASVD